MPPSIPSTSLLSKQRSTENIDRKHFKPSPKHLDSPDSIMMKLFLLFLLATVSAAQQYGCNICGCDNCTFANPTGVVNFVYDNKAEKRPCTLLQQQVENPTIYNRTYCHETIWKKAFEVCMCYSLAQPDIFLSDIEGEYTTCEVESQNAGGRLLTRNSLIPLSMNIYITQITRKDRTATRARWISPLPLLARETTAMEMASTARAGMARRTTTLNPRTIREHPWLGFCRRPPLWARCASWRGKVYGCSY